MEQRVCPDWLALRDKLDAAPAYHLFHLLDAFEMGIDQRFIDELPEVLGGLQLGAVRRLKHEPDAVRHGKVFRPVPARAIELQYDPLILARTGRFGEIGKDGLEHLLANRIRDVPHRSPSGGLNEAPNIEPLVAVMAKRDRAIAFGRPYPSHDRLQADPVLVHRPDLDGGIGMRAFLFSGSVLQFFLRRRDPLRLRLWDGAAAVFGSNIRWR